MDASRATGRARHRLLLELGRGGMGTVYLAIAEGPSGFAKLKVVKRLRTDLAEDPQFLQMFLEEARISARLNHPNVVQTFEVGFDGQHYFIEMEYLEGQSLEAVVRRASRGLCLPRPLGLWIVTQILTGLHFAHELTSLTGEALHVVHRDVSPHNVFVLYEGAVKLLDFGIAKAADSSLDTRTGVTKGKVTYMAPEHAAHTLVDRRADLFSVGVVLWQLLTGRRLWSDVSDAEIYAKLERGDLPSPRTVDPDLPESLERICMRALARAPEERYATAADFRAVIEEYLDASGARVGPTQASALMNEWFGDRRRTTRMEIEEALRTAPSAPSGPVDPPIHARLQAQSLTPSMDMSASHTLSSTRPKRRYSLAFALVGVAIAAAVTATARRESTASPAAYSPSGARPKCTSNAECAQRLGEAALCRPDDGCAVIESDQCHVRADPADVGNDSAIWIGAMLPLSGPEAPVGRDNLNAADLARRDFGTMIGGLPPSKPGGAIRPLALVACDDAVDPRRAARHLVEDLHLPAVIGFSNSKEVVDLATTVFMPRDVLAVAALNMGPLVTQIPRARGTPPMVWRTAVSITQSAAPMAAVVSEVDEREVRRSGVVSPGELIRVALVRPNDATSLSLSNALVSLLRFNGADVVGNGDNYREFVYDDPSIAGEAPNYDGVASALASFRPHVVICADEPSRVVPGVVARLEARWPNDGPYRPRYLLSMSTGQDELYRFVGSSAERRRRFLAVDLPANTETNVKFAMRYDEVFSPKVTPGTAPGVAYDAVYILAYAAYAVGDGPLSGSALAAAMARLVPPGDRVDVGPDRILEAIAALHSGRNIDLNGAATSLDFDLPTGENRSDFAVYCLKVDASGRAADTIESGLRYDSRTKTLSGASRCR
jgi:serine/threonine protein kinase/ABC-type branched-subunit amino acid transport system substrate-binding protein